MKKAIAAFLCIMLTTGMISGCAEREQEPETTQEDTAAEDTQDAQGNRKKSRVSLLIRKLRRKINRKKTAQIQKNRKTRKKGTATEICQRIWLCQC